MVITHCWLFLSVFPFLLDNSLLFEALSHDLPRADTEAKLETVIAIANSEPSERDEQLQNAKVLAKASIRALVQHEAIEILKSLEGTSKLIQSIHKKENLDNEF